VITDAGDFLQMASANLVKFGKFGEFMEIRRTIRVPSNFLSGCTAPITSRAVTFVPIWLIL